MSTLISQSCFHELFIIKFNYCLTFSLPVAFTILGAPVIKAFLENDENRVLLFNNARSSVKRFVLETLIINTREYKKLS